MKLYRVAESAYIILAAFDREGNSQAMDVTHYTKLVRKKEREAALQWIHAIMPENGLPKHASQVLGDIVEFRAVPGVQDERRHLLIYAFKDGRRIVLAGADVVDRYGRCLTSGFDEAKRISREYEEDKLLDVIEVDKGIEPIKGARHVH